MRIVLDANIYVSASLSPNGLCAQIVKYILENPNKCYLVTSPQITSEILASLSKPYILARSGKTAVEMKAWLDLIEFGSIHVESSRHTTIHCRDPDDDKYLSAALAAKADFIVSGDLDLSALSGLFEIPILTPRNFMNHLISPVKPTP